MDQAGNLIAGYLEKVHTYLNRFLPLSDDEFFSLAQFCEIREFQKKQQVVGIGEVDRFTNIIMRGIVRKYIIVNNKEITLQLSGEGHMIHSEISFNTQTPSETVIETIEPTTFVSISYENMQKLLETYPRMERLGRLMFTYMFIKKDYRDFSQLKSTTRERFIAFVETHPDMLQRVPQKYIASYLNIKPETFSRLKHLVKKRRQS